MKLQELICYLDELLNVSGIKDYCPNGLQVAGREEIAKIVTGVTACQTLLTAALAANADAIIVHHGYFWKNENPRIIDVKYNRLKTLLTNNISLLAYHLPLDLHPLYGNNAQLGKLLHLKLIKRAAIDGDLELFYWRISCTAKRQ